ncbi:polyisoprenoid-binding protein YceI [Ulvibacter sp. MAR_2010_11]|uniref:YceI family protein n=1 Tax=Ulvibacter sp. MAR_2010_11 TaxID=1250229 RepID=UPI000C2C79F7|nr:YceI family protein [Ulvibacter sp. MAR_2010_11]PKA82186.1 polyisoprenoid-binding protein YceI [Ulvibacter sp. MAR_2010_11]
MKKIVLKSILTAFVFIAFVACKEKGNDAMAGAAQEVAEATAEAVNYSVNLEDSQITWKGEKPTGTHHGTVQLASGTLAVKEGNVEAGTFIINMNTITDLDLDGKSKESLEAHLKGTVAGKEGDFFNVNQYPTATFEMTGTSEKEGKTYVSGNLTIKDKTHAIEFPATISSDGTMVKLISEPFVIDRTKWDVNFGSKSVFDNLGDKFINDDVEITIRLVASK